MHLLSLDSQWVSRAINLWFLGIITTQIVWYFRNIRCENQSWPTFRQQTFSNNLTNWAAITMTRNMTQFNTFIIACGMSAILNTSPLQAEDWAFRRSYFSHISNADQLSDPSLPQSRSAYRLPIKNSGPGFWVRGGYRYDSIIIRNGNSTDRTYTTEGWVDFLR